jgi:Ion channel
VVVWLSAHRPSKSAVESCTILCMAATAIRTRPGNLLAHREALVGRRFALLFLFLLASLIFYPFAQVSNLLYVTFRLLAGGVTVLSVYAVSFRRSLLMFAILLSVPALLDRAVLPAADRSLLSLLNIVLSFVFDLLVVVSIFRRVFARERPTSETIFGALCIYLLVGFAFTSLYALVGRFEAHAFYLDPASNLHTVPDRFDFIYYSFGTITSLGATGITAVSQHARSLTVLEAILGVLYLAVLIARLMGAYQRPAHSAT